MSLLSLSLYFNDVFFLFKELCKPKTETPKCGYIGMNLFYMYIIGWLKTMKNVESVLKIIRNAHDTVMKLTSSLVFWKLWNSL